MRQPRKLDTTERCARCGKRHPRSEMNLWLWSEPAKMSGAELWFCAVCWDEIQAKDEEASHDLR